MERSALVICGILTSHNMNAHVCVVVPLWLLQMTTLCKGQKTLHLSWCGCIV